MRITLSVLAFAFMLAACGGPSGQAIQVTEQENYERAIAESEQR
jgi:hypothetical protein